MRMRTLVVWLLVILCIQNGLIYAQKKAGKEKKQSLDSVYKSYRPDFAVTNDPRAYGIHRPPKKVMELSTEKTFHSRSYVERSSRADALVAAGIEKEKSGDYRLAIAIYQQVIDKFPETLYRISAYGIYVPAALYCQLRILNFPEEHLKFYREKNDSRVKELYEFSRQKNSLQGLANIRDNMLCTSYGAKAILVLGDAELDRGHYLAALEYFNMVKTYFPEKNVHTPELDLKIAYCRKMLGETVEIRMPGNTENSKLNPDQLKKLLAFIQSGKPDRPEFVLQARSPGCISAGDYRHMIPTPDPLGLNQPVWSTGKSGAGYHVNTLPVVTRRSVIYRHMNRIYCRSILNGELRWINDMGGRVSWNPHSKNRREDILVHDGMVFTPMVKNGPTLIAMDEITGQLKWSYGPMSAATQEEAMMSFRTAPAAGPSTVYAGYIMDNTASGVHIDSEYGIIAFESQTGRVKWQRAICRLRPGKFASQQFAGGVRKRIRSYASPPIYHQGTVYFCTNAGSIAALDALSGRIKWLTKYPYYSYPGDIHDATRGFVSAGDHLHPPKPGLWRNQPPLITGDDLYVLPVDSCSIFKLDRRTGKIIWTHQKLDLRFGSRVASGCGCGIGGITAYFMGPVKSGELLFVYGMRSRGNYDIKKAPTYHGPIPGGIFLLNPDNGQLTWTSKDPVAWRSKHPVVYLTSYVLPRGMFTLYINDLQFQVTARPFLSQDNNLYVGSAGHCCYPVYGMATNLAVLNLNQREFVGPRRTYLNQQMLKYAEECIKQAPGQLKKALELPAHIKKRKKTKEMIHKLKLLARDTIPENEHPSFLPFSRVTFKRFGITFELRTGPNRMSMLYDQDAVRKVIASRDDPESVFSAAELAIAENRTEEAVKLMETCLSRISPEDTGFRVLVNQQLFRAYQVLTRGSIRARDTEEELKYVTGMSRSSTTLGDEIQTLFAISEVYERKKEYVKAAKYLQAIIRKYGGYEYMLSSLYQWGKKPVQEQLQDILNRTEKLVQGMKYQSLLSVDLTYMGATLPLYYSAVSPAEKELNVRAEQVAVNRLVAMQQASAEFKTAYEQQAAKTLSNKEKADQMNYLVEYPHTQAGQEVLSELLADTEKALKATGDDFARAADLRKEQWRLADIARLSGFHLTANLQKGLLAPAPKPAAPLTFPLKVNELDMEEKRGPAWLVLDRKGARDVRPELMFMGGRVKKKFDNKFLLYAVDTATGKTVWKATEKRGETWFDEIRLKGKGNEPGFSSAMVLNDMVVVHGLFDVLAFNLSDGKLRWRYRVPFNFEIRYSVWSGDMLVLAGESDTVMLYLPTRDPSGEPVWQENEQGELYAEPWFYKDRLIMVRKMPFNVTIRYRSTGKLIGRHDFDNLTLWQHHPLLKNGPEEYPVSHDRHLLALCGSGYYILFNVEDMRVQWRRLMDKDAQTPVRMELNGDYLSIIKKNFDAEVMYMLSSRTGNVLWHTDPKKPGQYIPMHSMRISDGKLYGLRKHPGQGFYFCGVDCKTGKELFRQYNQKGYQARPEVRLRRQQYGNVLVAEVKDRQDFELIGFDMKTGKPGQRLKIKGLGNIGEPGRASATIQNGCMVLHGKKMVKIAAP